MHKEAGQRPGKAAEQEAIYFSFLAEVGITKHMGALESTKQLIELCGIEQGQAVLDVGCGVGITACYLTKRYGCRVVGIDITERMIDRCNERARRERVEDAVEFRVADAQDLPLEDGRFDVVISESVNVFLADSRRAMREYVRVARTGGRIGLNETTLLRSPPPAQLLPYMYQVAGFEGEIPTVEDWEDLLRSAGLREIVAYARALNVREEARSRLERFGFREMVSAVGRVLVLALKDPASKAFIRQTLGGTKLLSRDVLEYLGYGIYAGTK
jgi:ubiquinone/menaquinone biosynthesis C-methylase UbiE